MRTPLVLAIAILFSFDAFAADFAPDGSAGVLTLKIEAEGAGKHEARRGAGWDREEWKMKNSGQFTIRLQAHGAAADPTAAQRQAGAVRGAIDRIITEKDQEVLDKWEEKTDACNGNEACENRVLAQQMADPQYLRIMQKMQGGAPAILGAARAVDLGPAVQIWSTQANPSSASGSMQVDLQKKVYGIVDTGGGGAIDETCRYKGNVKIAPNSAESRVDATVRIDAKASQYEIRLPADVFIARVKGACTNNKGGKGEPTQAIRLIGEAPPRGAKDFKQALTLKGTANSARSPKFGGTHTITTLQGYGGAPVNVSVEWQFSATDK